MSKTAVVGIVEYENKVLIGLKTKRKGHAMSEEWHIPGGKVESDETPTEALIREIREEASIPITNIQLYEQTNHDGFTVVWYTCSAEHANVHHGDDLVDAKFVNKEDVSTYCGENAIARWPPKARIYFYIQ